MGKHRRTTGREEEERCQWRELIPVGSPPPPAATNGRGTLKLGEGGAWHDRWRCCSVMGGVELMQVRMAALLLGGPLLRRKTMAGEEARSCVVGRREASVGGDRKRFIFV